MRSDLTHIRVHKMPHRGVRGRLALIYHSRDRYIVLSAARSNIPNNRSKDLRHRCRDCLKTTSVTINTVLHDTRLPLKTWFKALNVITDGRVRLSAHHLSRYIGVSYPTTYKMYHKVRELMGQEVKYSEEFLQMGRFYTMMCTILHQYNYVSPKQLINYTGEYEYKYNNRGQNDKMFEEMLKKLFTTCK